MIHTAVFVLGGSPAILTESLAAYSVRDSGYIPNQIRVITTACPEHYSRTVSKSLDPIFRGLRLLKLRTAASEADW